MVGASGAPNAVPLAEAEPKADHGHARMAMLATPDVQEMPLKVNLVKHSYAVSFCVLI